MGASPPRDALELLLELQALDGVPRMGYTLRGVAEPESVAAHSFHVGFLVWMVGRELPELNLARALELALLHDLAEVRLGDLPRTASSYLPPGAKHGAEQRVADDLLAPLPSAPSRLLAEYQAGATLEARLVKACDRLQLMVKVAFYEEAGRGALAEFWDEPESFDDGGFPRVGELFAALLRRREERRGGAG